MKFPSNIFCVALLTGSAFLSYAWGETLTDARYNVPVQAAKTRLVPGWLQIASNSVRRSVTNFSKPDGGRNSIDLRFPKPLDMSGEAGFSFWLYYPDATHSGDFMAYVHSGNGWRSYQLPLIGVGPWYPIKITRSNMTGQEGKPGPWSTIDCFRLTAIRATQTPAPDVPMDIAHFAFLGGTEFSTLVVAGESCAASGSSEPYVRFAAIFQNTLQNLGVESLMVSDTDLTDEMLSRAKICVFPYNPSLPKTKLACVRAFAQRGGKFICCYTAPDEIRNLMGFKVARWYTSGENGNPPIVGFGKSNTPWADQPDFTPQASHMSIVPKSIDTQSVVRAFWRLANDKNSTVPAILETSNGVIFSHVWQNARADTSLKLMASCIASLDATQSKCLANHNAKRQAAEEKARKNLAARKPRPKGEFHGIWYESAKMAGGWDKTTTYLATHGFTDFIVCIGKQDAEFTACRDACRKAGIRFHAWRRCYRDAEAGDENCARQVDINGKKLSWRCPSDPLTKKREVEGLLEAAHAGADGIHLDYIRYPGNASCFCSGCRKRFEKMLGHSATNWPKLNSPELQAAWGRFRCQQITDVVRETVRRTHLECPKVQLSAAVQLGAFTHPAATGQDWKSWCEEGLLDFVCPMNYSASVPYFDALLRTQKVCDGKTRVYPGIGSACFNRPTRAEEAIILANEIDCITKNGYSGYTIYCWGDVVRFAFDVLGK